MAKTEKQATVKYNEDTDSFELWLRNSPNEDWGLSSSAKCMSIEDEVETNFIHFSFLREVLNCITLGYKVSDA